jgi:hypothetical protein
MSIARYFAKPTKTTTVFPSVSTTVFTVTGGYPVGQLDVFLNGVRLVSGDDYTATNGTSFTLTNAAISGDVVQHTVYPVSPLNYLNSTGGTITGAVNLTYAAPLLSFSNTAQVQTWQLGSSGSSAFFLNDQTNTKIPFLIAANAPSDSLSITATGLVTIATGQIRFPVVSNVSTNANTLDDYEEGTWTPTFIGTTTNPTVTYAATTYGHYTKIGKAVSLQGRILLTAASGGAGNLRIAGLPFAPSAGANNQAMSIGTRTSFTTQAPNQCFVDTTAAQIVLVNFTTTASQTNTTANLAATSDITFGGVYMTDA